MVLLGLVLLLLLISDQLGLCVGIELLREVSSADVVVVAEFVDVKVDLAKDGRLFHYKLHLFTSHLLPFLLLPCLFLLHFLHLYLVVALHFVLCIATLEVQLDSDSTAIELLSLLNSDGLLALVLFDLLD